MIDAPGPPNDQRTGPSLSIDPDFGALLAGSYARLVGSPLVPSGLDAQATAVWLYEEAPFCVLAHDTDPDPRFIYANTAAQTCFEYDWDTFVQLRSRFSAEAPDREERRRLLDAVTRDGFATGYRGLRVAKTGRRFWIEDGTVWQLFDTAGNLHGQAAVFRRWHDA